MDSPFWKCFFDRLKAEALPGIWNQGVQAARSQKVFLIAESDSESTFQVRSGEALKPPKVQVWPEENDSYCSCESLQEPCLHLIAVAVAKKQNLVKDIRDQESALALKTARLGYRLETGSKGLQLIRGVWTEGSFRQLPSRTLTAYLGGIRSGRIPDVLPLFQEEDLQIDEAFVGDANSFTLTPATLSKWRALIQRLFFVDLAKNRLEIGGKSSGGRLIFRKLSHGVEWEWKAERSGLADSAGEFSLIDNHLSRNIQKSNLPPLPQPIQLRDLENFLEKILPTLERMEIPMDGLDVFPKQVKAEPQLAYELRDVDGKKTGDVLITSTLEYRLDITDEVIAKTDGQRLEGLSWKYFPFREMAKERALAHRLQSEREQVLGRPVQVAEKEALNWIQAEKTQFSTKSSDLIEKLRGREIALNPPALSVDGDSLHFRFPNGSSFSDWADAVRDGDDLITLPNGTFGRLPSGWIHTHFEKILKFLRGRIPRPDSGQLPLEPVDLLNIHPFADNLGLTLSPEITAKLAAFESPDSLVVPEVFSKGVQLRPYQSEGIRWLLSRVRNGISALLSDDMGLGKTLQTLALVEKGRRTLVVAPTSVLPVWEKEIRKFRPDLTVAIYHGASRKLSEGKDLTITSYGLLRQDLEKFSTAEWDLAILDEAQNIRNPESGVARAAFQLPAKVRLALSGTPIENRLQDLKSLFHFLIPGYLENETVLSRIREKVLPLNLRRTKSEVLKDLPPRTEQIFEVEFSEAEREFYQTILASTQKEVLDRLDSGNDPGGGGQLSVLQILEAILRLRQVCADIRLLPGQKNRNPPRSSKSEAFLEYLKEALASGHRCLVFSQWTQYLDLIEMDLDAEGIRYSRLDGSTRNRAELVENFQRADDQAPSVFLLSLKAGGVGITLTAADHVIFLDPWWNPSAEDQAADRVYRLGQNRPVTVTRFICRDSIEERVLGLQQQKRTLRDQIFTEGVETSTEFLSKSDLKFLID